MSTGYKADAVVSMLHHSMKTLREHVARMPARFQKFRGLHDELAKKVAVLAVSIDDTRLMFDKDSKGSANKITKEGLERIKNIHKR